MEKLETKVYQTNLNSRHTDIPTYIYTGKCIGRTQFCTGFLALIFCKNNPFTDGKPDDRPGVRVGNWNVGSRGTEVCDKLRKRRMDVLCLQKVRWRGQVAQFMGVKGRRYKLWWSGIFNSDGTRGKGVLVKEELCEKVVEVRRKSDIVMTVVMALEEEVVRIIRVYGPQSGRTCRKRAFL